MGRDRERALEREERDDRRERRHPERRHPVDGALANRAREDDQAHDQPGAENLEPREASAVVEVLAEAHERRDGREREGCQQGVPGEAVSPVCVGDRCEPHEDGRENTTSHGR